MSGISRHGARTVGQSPQARKGNNKLGARNRGHSGERCRRKETKALTVPYLTVQTRHNRIGCSGQPSQGKGK